MVSDDADFADYLAARWPVIEETLLRVGCPESLVVPVALRGLAFARRSWRRTVRDDVDVCVLGDVLREARGHLGFLTDVPRVLEDVAGLRQDQVERVLERQARPIVRRQLTLSPHAAITTAPPTVGAVVAEGRAARAGRARAWAVALWVVAAFTAIVVVGASTDESVKPGVAWYADGVLHGDGYDIEVPQARQLLLLHEGTAYVDGAGEIHQVDEDGHVRQVASSVADVAAVASSDGTRLAWVEEERGTLVRIVVYDVARGRVDDVLDLDAHAQLTGVPLTGLRLVALDGPTLHLSVGGTDLTWRVGTRDVEPYGVGLVDVAGGTEARMKGGILEVRKPLLGTAHAIDGVAAELSPDGRFVLTAVSSGAGDDPTGRAHRVEVHDATSGRQIPSGLGRDTLVLEAAFGPGPSVSYLVVPTRDPASGSDVEVEPLVVVRTCELPQTTCHDLTPVAPGTADPLLAQ